MKRLNELLKVTVWTKDGNTVQIDGNDLQVAQESREGPVHDLSDVDLNEAKKVADSLRSTHRARRRHGSESIFNQKVIDSAKKTMHRFK